MTNNEKFLRACEHAIHRMIDAGNYGVLLDVHSNDPVMVDYVDVLEWIDEQKCKRETAMKTWTDHFDAFGLKPCAEGKAPFQLMDSIFQEYRTIYENETDDQIKINAAIEADEWTIVLEIVHFLRDDCIAQYDRTHDKRLVEIAKLCEEAMKTAKSRLYALKWLLND